MDVCKECGEPLLGRSDKKFCDEQCRSAYHNHLRRTEFAHISKTNRTLLRNRKILSELLKSGVNELSIRELIESGFIRNYITSYYVKDGKPVLLCYEFSIMIDDNGTVHISTKS